MSLATPWDMTPSIDIKTNNMHDVHPNGITFEMLENAIVIKEVAGKQENISLLKFAVMLPICL